MLLKVTTEPAPPTAEAPSATPVNAGFCAPSLTKPAKPPPPPIACANAPSDSLPEVLIAPAARVQVEDWVGSASPPAPPVEPSWNCTPLALMPVAAVTAAEAAAAADGLADNNPPRNGRMS